MSLLELLRMMAERFVHLSAKCGFVAVQMSISEDPQEHVSRVAADLISVITSMNPDCEHLGLVHSQQQIVRMLESWKQSPDIDLLRHGCLVLWQRLEDELESRVVLMLTQAEGKRYEFPYVDWNEILFAFPEVTDNVIEMNRCYALSRYPASVFHSLLIVESGVIRLGKVIGATDPKAGWDATCRQLTSLMKGGRNSYSLSVPFESLEQLSVCIEAMKFAWRNKVNHEAGRLIVLDPSFTQQIAEEIMVASRSLMRRLSEVLPK